MTASKHDPFRAEIGGQRLHPESQMMSYGYRPDLSEGAVKCPIFQTSTFVFKSAEEGKAFFELAYGLRKAAPEEEVGLIYSRVNNPDLEILEDRLTLWDGAEEVAVFSSGMAAISTTLLAHLQPGDVVLHSEPVYGGTDFLLKTVLPRFGIQPVSFMAGNGLDDLEERLLDRSIAERTAMLYIETPANPTNGLVDIEAATAMVREICTSGASPAAGCGGQHLSGPALAASAQAWGGPGPLFGHQVHRRPQRRHRRRGARVQGVDAAHHGHAHDPGNRINAADRLAAAAQPGDAQTAHDLANEERTLRGRLSGRSSQGRAGLLLGPFDGR